LVEEKFLELSSVLQLTFCEKFQVVWYPEGKDEIVSERNVSETGGFSVVAFVEGFSYITLITLAIKNSCLIVGWISRSNVDAG
jgi:hypothetical protein